MEVREDINGYTLTQHNAVLDSSNSFICSGTDKEFVITWFYSSSCRVFTLSKISLLPGACKFSSLGPAFPILYTWGVMGFYFLANHRSYIFLLISWFAVKDNKVLPCPRNRFFSLFSKGIFKIIIHSNSERAIKFAPTPTQCDRFKCRGWNLIYAGFRSFE